MFTGIIEETGEVKELTRRGDISVLTVKCSKVREDANTGDSISVNGACLTVVKAGPGFLSFEVMNETLKVTDLGSLRPGSKVNLERSLKADSRLSGHFVTGHIDCTGNIISRRMKGGDLCYEIGIPAQFMGYIVPKGSVALDGISLTVADKSARSFTVHIIPHTLDQTILAAKFPSHKVNVELDILAKYSRVIGRR